MLDLSQCWNFRRQLIPDPMEALLDACLNINSRLKGAVDRELRGEYIYMDFPPIFKNKMLMNVAQKLFFRTFFEDPACAKCSKKPDATFWKRISPYIFYMKLVVSQHYVFWYSKLEVGPCNLTFFKFKIFKFRKFNI